VPLSPSEHVVILCGVGIPLQDIRESVTAAGYSPTTLPPHPTEEEVQDLRTWLRGDGGILITSNLQFSGMESPACVFITDNLAEETAARSGLLRGTTRLVLVSYSTGLRAKTDYVMAQAQYEKKLLAIDELDKYQQEYRKKHGLLTQTDEEMSQWLPGKGKRDDDLSDATCIYSVYARKMKDYVDKYGWTNIQKERSKPHYDKRKPVIDLIDKYQQEYRKEHGLLTQTEEQMSERLPGEGGRDDELRRAYYIYMSVMIDYVEFNGWTDIQKVNKSEEEKLEQLKEILDIYILLHIADG